MEDKLVYIRVHCAVHNYVELYMLSDELKGL